MRGCAASLMMLTASLSGCTWTTTRPEPPTSEPEPSAEASEEPLAQQPSQPAVEPTAAVEVLPPSTPIMPRIAVESSQGADKNVMLAAFETTSGQLSRCQGQGLMRVRVKADDEQTAFKLQEGSTMAKNARECVLKELSIIDIEEVVETAPGASPSDRPLGVDSVLVISFP